MPVLHLLIDADAWLALRKLRLLDDLVRLAKERLVQLSMTGVVANELSSIGAELVSLASVGVLAIHKVPTRSPAGVLYRQHRKLGHTRSGKAIHKGEQEMMAWAESEAPGCLVVSGDAGARDFARERKLDSADVLDLVCRLIVVDLLTLAECKVRLSLWDEVFTGCCRPTGYSGLEGALTVYRDRLAQS